MLSDASYVNSILSSLPGVDPDDPSIQQALSNRPSTDQKGAKEDNNEGGALLGLGVGCEDSWRFGWV